MNNEAASHGRIVMITYVPKSVVLGYSTSYRNRHPQNKRNHQPQLVVVNACFLHLYILKNNFEGHASHTYTKMFFKYTIQTCPHELLSTA